MEMGRKMMVVVVLVMVLLEGSKALELCNINEDGLMACKPAVTAPNPVTPTPECCQALSGADLTCLCSYRNSFILPSLGIDPDLAMALPAKCNLTPPTNC
ncbi:putative lipid-transfer protein DIR1 [Cornus florida]|uniref:putative lipid-transfer protein DIR1 n=1 Tax=Cornus florida TaxID=4283 RepID=UPI00289729FC|nr:putative lipid-transfer protein DIR1 [Cornus florida]